MPGGAPCKDLSRVVQVVSPRPLHKRACPRSGFPGFQFQCRPPSHLPAIRCRRAAFETFLGNWRGPAPLRRQLGRSRGQDAVRSSGGKVRASEKGGPGEREGRTHTEARRDRGTEEGRNHGAFLKRLPSIAIDCRRLPSERMAAAARRGRSRAQRAEERPCLAWANQVAGVFPEPKLTFFRNPNRLFPGLGPGPLSAATGKWPGTRCSAPFGRTLRGNGRKNGWPLGAPTSRPRGVRKAEDKRKGPILSLFTIHLSSCPKGTAASCRAQANG